MRTPDREKRRGTNWRNYLYSFNTCLECRKDGPATDSCIAEPFQTTFQLSERDRENSRPPNNVISRLSPFHASHLCDFRSGESHRAGFRHSQRARVIGCGSGLLVKFADKHRHPAPSLITGWSEKVCEDSEVAS